MAGLLDQRKPTRGLLDIAKYGDGGLLSSYEPSLRDKVNYWLADHWYGDTRQGVEQAKNLSNVLETVTPYGLLTGAYDAGRSAGSGDYLGAGIAGAMTALPLPAPVEKEGKKYAYGMLYRKPSHSTLPEGFASFGPATAEHKFGTVEYNRPLSSQELDSFELVPLDPNHPRNIKKSFEDFQTRFVDEFSSSGETYRSKENGLVVTPNLSGDGWQVTHFTKSGEPMGHEVITDFDELSRLVWSSERKTNSK